MRKWIRDRAKRRKKPGAGSQEGQNSGEQKPAPLQPTFLDRDDSALTSAPPVSHPEPEYESQPETDPEPIEAETDAPVPAAEVPAAGGERGRRGRRRGRRGRGNRGREQGQSPVLPIAPGLATGEAAEAELDGVVPETPAPAPPSPQKPKGKKTKGAVVLAIGLPGSGKSSWFKRHNIIPLSSDLVRGLLFDDPTEQRYQDLVFSTLRAMLRARMIAGRPWNYIDATNLSPKERHSWIKMARDFGYEAHAVFFDVPTEVCMERNRMRSRNVPDEIMQRMGQKLRPPKFEEGFAKITIVRLKKQPPAAPESDQDAVDPSDELF
ncbi:MAG: AAA family ATPase [Terriglobia bacterium]|jgi:predicted kinase|nr:AAA family ATPase [Terriglobia bacterium]